MTSLSRYFLVFMLVANLVVDATTVRQSLGDNCCQPAYVSSCDCPCPQACVVDCTEAVTVWNEQAHCGDYSAAVVVVETDCLGCQSEIPVDTSASPSTTHEQVPAEAMPEPQAGAIDDEPTTPEVATEPAEERTALPPAPLATPDTPTTPEPTTPLPGPAETPDPSIVGDRYSNSGDTGAAQTPAESTPNTPTPSADGEAGDVDDIFGEPTSSPPEESSDPFPAQPAEEAPSPEPANDVEDIFGPSTSTAQDAADVVAAESNPIENSDMSAVAVLSPNKERAVDPLGHDSQVLLVQKSVLSSAGGLKSKSNRTWTDNTAKYECEARLVRVAEKHVVLIRSSGKQVTVPFSRLANDDLHFVRQQLTALRSVKTRDAEAAKLAVQWSR